MPSHKPSTDARTESAAEADARRGARSRRADDRLDDLARLRLVVDAGEDRFGIRAPIAHRIMRGDALETPRYAPPGGGDPDREYRLGRAAIRTALADHQAETDAWLDAFELWRMLSAARDERARAVDARRRGEIPDLRQHARELLEQAEAARPSTPAPQAPEIATGATVPAAESRGGPELPVTPQHG